MIKFISILLLECALVGCASDFVLPPPACLYVEHHNHACHEEVVLTNDEGKPWSCNLPEEHYSDDEQHCKWDK